LSSPEQKLLFLLVYLKTYPLQVLMGELFGLSQPGANYWIHRLLPVLRVALDGLGVLPERNPNDFARSQTASGTEPRLIIDGTERRRQRPKNPEKQALHYSGKKKTHTDKNVVLVNLRDKDVGFLSRTYVGKTHDKKVAESEGVSYPPRAELYKDTGFQGYEPAGTRTYQAKKKAAPRGTHGRGEANQPEAGTHPSPCRACPLRRETFPHCERCLAEHQRRNLGFGHGSGLWITQPSSSEPKAATETVADPYF
jgi:hypothetical protein